MAAKDFELILRVQADLQQAVSQLRTLNDQMRVTKTAAVEASGGLAGIRSSAGAAETGIRNVGTQATALNSKLGLINRTAHDLRNAFIFAFAIHEVVDFTKSLVDANVEAQRIQNTMEQAFGKDGAAQQLQYVHDLAEKLGLDFKSAAEGFAGFGASAQGTGIQTEDLRKLFTGLSEAATVLHSSTQDVNGVMIQLGQAMSLGKLQMQDIRAIAQHLPGTMTALGEAAKRMGTNLTDALKSGGLEAKQFIGVLGDVLHERFGTQAVEASHSLNAELNRLRSTLFALQTDGTGFATQFAGAIRSLNTSLNDPGVQAGLRNLIAGLGEVASAAIDAAAKGGEFIKWVQSLSEIAAFKQTGAVESEAGYGAALMRQQALQAELDRRASSGLAGRGRELASAASSLANPFNFSATGNADAAQQVSLALKSDADLKAELTKLTANINQYRAGAAAPARNPQEGDTRGLFVGEGGKTHASANPDPAALRRAAELAKQATSAQNALTQSLIDMQAQLDPTAAVYAKYDAAVKKATDEAELAKQAHGANAQAIDSQRDAVIALAAKVRDAALDQLAEKDRQAWEALRRSFETPAQVRVEDALKQIQQLNDLLAKGVITSQQYHDALARIGEKSVTGALPTYQGLDASVGGSYSELGKNYQAEKDLNAAYQAQKLALDKKFNDQDEAQYAAHVAALNKLDADRSKEQKKIEDARGQLQLQAASDLFGQLATLSSSHNKKMAAIGKAAAIAQAIIRTYETANEAMAALSGIPVIGPALGAAAAAVAIAAGLANVAQIRSQNVSGYKGGGAIQGPGTETSDSVPILASNGEYMHNAAAVRYYGIPMMDAINRRMFPRFADGGLIHPLANAPRLSAAELGTPPQLPTGSLAGNASDNVGKPAVGVRIINSVDPQFARDAINTPEGETVIMNMLGRNATKLKQMVR
jgi:tape measure domain-containing protein